jgi:hypothetical protein
MSVDFLEDLPGINGFSNKSYRGYENREEEEEEFNLFLAIEAMVFQGMAISSAPCSRYGCSNYA